MTRFFCFIQFIFNTHLIFSQELAHDFTLTDVNGYSYNLYNELDAGKTVVLNFYIYTCGTCQINTPILENIWQTYGYSGDSLWVWGIETSGTHDSNIVSFMLQYNSTFPNFSTLYDDVVIYVYNITYTPQYYVICPNKIMKLVTIQQIEQSIMSCKQTTQLSYFDSEATILWTGSQILLPSEKAANVKIYDISGKLLYNSLNVIKVYDFSFLEKGIYIFKVEILNQSVQKLVIRH